MNAPVPRDQYAAIAAVYDLLIPDPPGMIEFYLAQAGRHAGGGAILEVGPGTGRLTVELARAGHTVVAADLSEQMLDILRLKLARMPAGAAARVRPVTADQRVLDLDGDLADARFPLVLCTGGTLQHALDKPEYLRVLRCFRERLAPGGALVLDLDGVPRGHGAEAFREDFPTFSLAHVTPRWHTVRSWNDTRRISATGRVRVDCWFEMSDASGGVTDRFCYPFEHTYLQADELAAWVAEAGFVVEELHGGFLGQPPTPFCADVVVVARATD